MAVFWHHNHRFMLGSCAPGTQRRLALCVVGALGALACGVGKPPVCQDLPPEAVDCETTPDLCGLPTRSEQPDADPAHTIDVVFLPAGYSQFENGTFLADVNRIVAGLRGLNHSVMGRDPALFNVHTVDLSKAQKAREHFPLGECFPEDSNACPGSDFRRVALAAVNAPDADVVVVLFRANDEPRRGCATQGIREHGLDATIHVRANQPLWLIDHEFAHAVAGVGDEYDDGLGCFTDDAPLVAVAPWTQGPAGMMFWPNLSTDATGQLWQTLAPGIPDVGGALHASCVYNPTGTCRMDRADDAPYCPVCDRAINRVLQRMRSGTDDEPPLCSLELPTSPDLLPARFTVTARGFDHDGVEVSILRRPGNLELAAERSLSTFQHVTAEFVRPPQSVQLVAQCRDTSSSVTEQVVDIP